VRVVFFLLLLPHVGVAALWLGSMAYSLFVVQPRVARLLRDPGRAEEIYRELGAGNRWRVIGLIAALWVTGILLVIVHKGSVGTLWWSAVAAKALLLGAASALFWWVSWRGWPRRVFALPAEVPAEQARFRRVALWMLALAGVAFVLGVGVTALR
jgi:hypothetical protein